MSVIRSTKRKVLYLPSTPLNLLVSIAHAVAYSSEQTAQLILIDQKDSEDNIYLKALKSWSASPFERIDLTLGQGKGRKKLQERKSNFAKLSGLIKDFPADAIAVGSDRRVEFQYLMHLRTLSTNEVEGWYLDDGLYSYAGRPYKWTKDQVNSLLKKIVYGCWWKEPKTVGASEWVKQAWLFSPENAVELIQNKTCHAISSEWFVAPNVSEFVSLVVEQFGLDSQIRKQLKSIDLFILIPHPNNILKMDGYVGRLEIFLKKTQQLGLKVAVKYHPRSKGPDFLRLKERYDTLLLPNDLAFEFVMPLLGLGAIILGSVSTVLMTAKWLRADVASLAVLDKNDPFAQQFRGIIEQLGVTIVSEFDAVFERIKK